MEMNPLKTVMFGVMLALLPCGLSAQNEYTQLRNSGFEDGFDTFTAKVGLVPSTKTFEEPKFWNSFGSGEGAYFAAGADVRLKKSLLTRPGSEGSTSAVIYSTAVLGVAIANANLTTGRVSLVSMTPANNYNTTRRSADGFNHPFNALPDSFTVWVKFVPKEQGNKARVAAVIHDDFDLQSPSTNVANNSHIVGNAEINYDPAPNNNWQLLSFPFDYDSYTSKDPRYILVTFTSNQTPGGGKANDSVYIDDINLTYNKTLKIKELTESTYTLPEVGAGVEISIPYTLTGAFFKDNVVTAQLSDASGSFDSPIILGTDTTGFVSGTNERVLAGLIPAGTPVGNAYRIRLVSSHYEIVGENNGVDLTILKTVNTSLDNVPFVDAVKVTGGSQNIQITGDSHVMVYSVSGLKVADVKVVGSQVIPVSQAGIYMVRVINNSMVKTTRIVVK